MEQFQSQIVKSGDTNLNDGNVTNINNTNLWAGRSVNSPSLYSTNYNYDEPRREYSAVKTKKITSWWNDPERKRKRRVASYKLYAAEGKFKHSVKKGFRWLKIKCIKIVTSL